MKRSKDFQKKSQIGLSEDDPHCSSLVYSDRGYLTIGIQHGRYRLKQFHFLSRIQRTGWCVSIRKRIFCPVHERYIVCTCLSKEVNQKKKQYTQWRLSCYRTAQKSQSLSRILESKGVNFTLEMETSTMPLTLHTQKALSLLSKAIPTSKVAYGIWIAFERDV